MKKNFFILLLFFFSSLTFSQVQNKGRFVAVTFDDLPFVNHKTYSPDQQKERTEKLLNTFQDYNIPAVGFVNEYKLFENDSLITGELAVLRQWVNNNYELGNHTYSHESLNNISVEEYEQDIIKGEKYTKELLAKKEKKIRYFRYPFLQKGNEESKKKAIENFLKEKGYTNAPVTLDNSGWVFARAYDIAIEQKDSVKMKMLGEKYIEYMSAVFDYFEKQSRFLFEREIKQVLLLHANALNSDYFYKVCEIILNRGYKFISLQEALKDPIYQKEETYVGNWGFSWINRWALTDGKGKDFYKDEPEPGKEIFKLAKLDN